MRVLHMIPDIGISNGVMSVVLNYAKAMPDDIKFDVVYFAEKPKTRQKDIEALGGRVFKIDPPSPLDLLTGKMNGFFAEHKNEWDVLHIHCPHFAVFIAPFAKKAGIKNIIVHCHTTEFSLKGNSKRNKLLSLYSKYFIKNKLACSNVSGKFWYGNKKFTVLNNAVDIRKFAFDENARKTAREKLGVQNDFVVSHIGRTDVSQKNHPFLLNVFAKIKKLKQNTVLLLIGASESDETEKICASLGITESVKYLGIRNDVPDLLSCSDVFIFPSTSEGLPVSVVEAQASGLPVLMSDSVTDEVLINDNTAAFSLDLTYDEWANKAIELLAVGDGRTSAVKSALADEWDIKKCAEKLVGFYELRG